MIEQSFTSKATAVNYMSNKLPAIFKLVDFPENSLVLDYGGGTQQSEALANAYLSKYNCQDLVYDPFNMPESLNKQALKIVRENGGADVALLSNVLNVVKEEEVRLDILRTISNLLKPGGTLYITVYEGDGSGAGKQSGPDSWQNNRKTAGYLDEVNQVFNATRRGKLIIAKR